MPGLRFIGCLMLIAPIACTSREGLVDETATVARVVRAAATAEAAAPRTPAGDSATSVLARYLELSREGASNDPSAPDSLMGCQMRDGMYQPIEMLAAYEVTGQAWRGDTAVVRARTVTTAEENGDPRRPDGFVAVQRVRRGEWEWDVVREEGRWRVCNGPQFGFWGDDGITTWRPAGASSVSARALADSIWRASRP
jgi:hypothetical protein